MTCPITTKKTSLMECPKCGQELEQSLVIDSDGVICCGECGLLFNNYPKKIEFI